MQPVCVYTHVCPHRSAGLGNAHGEVEETLFSHPPRCRFTILRAFPSSAFAAMRIVPPREICYITYSIMCRRVIVPRYVIAQST